MKIFPFVLIPLTALLSGCGESRAGVDAAHEPVPAARYKEGHGLELSEAARRFIGLETAEARSERRGDAEVIVVPAPALLRTVRGDFVYVVNGEKLLRTPVAAGETHDDRVAILDGLYEGDRVASAGVRELALAEMQALNGGVGCADGH